MKKLSLLLALMVADCTFKAYSQPAVEYRFETSTGVGTPSPYLVNNTIIASASDMYFGAGLTGPPGYTSGANSGGYGCNCQPLDKAMWASGWGFNNSLTVATTDYLGVLLTAPMFTVVFIDSVKWRERKSSTGPSLVQIRTSSDSYSGVVWDSGTMNASTGYIPRSVTSVFPSFSTTLNIRLYGYFSTNPGGTLRIDTLRIYAHTMSTLPIELLSFTGEKTDENKVKLLWSTASEQDNDYFTVFRCNDLVTWQEIGRVTGAGSSQSRIDYELVDAFPLVGTNYYKLRQTDFDGTFVDSHVIAVDVDVGDDFIVYPNPVQRGVEFQTSLKVSYIADAAGRRIALENNIIENSGAYTLVHIDESGDVTNCRIIVE